MKAERRHELKTNTLARGLESLPEVSREHGSKILVGVLVVLLAIFLIRQRIVSSREAATAAAHSLDSARGLITQFDDAIDMGMAQNPAAMANLRQKVYSGATDAVQTVLDATDDPRLLAEARLALGDLNWKLANFPDLPGAATQPTLQFSRSREDLLKAAADSYVNVIEDPAGPPESVRTARLGLAAVYENRREWDKARAEYQKLVNDASLPKPFKDLAVRRLNDLELDQRPPLIGAPATADSTLTNLESLLRTGGAASPPATTASATSASRPAPAPAQPPAPAASPRGADAAPTKAPEASSLPAKAPAPKQ